MKLRAKYKIGIGAMKAFRRGGWAGVGAFGAFFAVGLLREQGFELWSADFDMQMMGALTILFTGLGKFLQNFAKEGVEK